MPESISVIQIIQLILAPAVMINASGLLILSISNKFSTVLNRIRLLNDERRRILHVASERPLQTQENQRLNSLMKQLEGLVFRSRMIRNSIACYIFSVALFVLSSLLIGISTVFPIIQLRVFILLIFLLGMIIVLIGVLYMGFDVFKGYRIVEFEVRADE
jgi:hypothetical protein